MRAIVLFASLVVAAGCGSTGSGADGSVATDGARGDGSGGDGAAHGGDGSTSGDGSTGGDGSTDAGFAIDFGDSLPVLSVGDVTVTEGDAGTVDAVFTVTLAGTYAGPITVHFTTMDGSATTGDADYAAQTGMLTFGPTDTTQTVTVAVSGDATAEPDETFTLLLDGAVNAHVLDGSGTGTIVDDDCTYVLSAPSHDFPTADAATGSVTVTTNAPVCVWTAMRDDSGFPSPWLTITSGGSYTGTADVAFAVTANPRAARSGVLTIAGSSFAVTQGGVPCTYTISPLNLSFDTLLPPTGPTSICSVHTEMAMVVATPACRWSVVVDPGSDPAGWLTVTTGAGPSTGTGATQIVTYRVQSNAHSDTSRSGTLTIVDSVTGPSSAVLGVDQVADPTHTCP